MQPIKIAIALCAILLGWLPNWELKAQIRVDTSYSPQEIVSDILLGPGIQVRNVRYRGSKIALGHFVNDSPVPDIQEGIVLSTGSVFDVVGPNRIPSSGRANVQRGDHDLDEIARGITQDAAVLEFDFMAQKDSLHFFFFFASDEYNEYVGSEFNDVFAFLISGPGYEEPTNIAVIRSHRTFPISVNTVNAASNAKCYIDNNVWNSRGFVIKDREKELNQTLWKNFELDGLTTVLRARARVVPGKVYHIKIGIADVSDARFDSAVFLEAKSFTSEPYDPLADRHLIQRKGTQPADSLFAKSEWEPKPDPKTDKEPVFIPTFGRPLPQKSTVSRDTFPPIPGSLEDDQIAYRIAVEFDFDSDVLTAEALENLAVALARAKKIKGVKVMLRGHTDIVGNHAYNQQLSERRADRVGRYFQDAGLGSGRIQTEGLSFDEPIAPNTTPEGRARNRRVEVLLLKP
jgi:outer membrane protein OmpA-like peptidoglycan-associated protein